jgi:hypothetical protein
MSNTAAAFLARSDHDVLFWLHRSWHWIRKSHHHHFDLTHFSSLFRRHLAYGLSFDTYRASASTATPNDQVASVEYSIISTLVGYCLSF